MKEPRLTGMQLLRLRDCIRSTQLGMVDQWPGPEMAQLATLGLLERKGNGWRATEDAFLFIRTQRDALIRM